MRTERSEAQKRRDRLKRIYRELLKEISALHDQIRVLNKDYLKYKYWKDKIEKHSEGLSRNKLLEAKNELREGEETWKFSKSIKIRLNLQLKELKKQEKKAWKDYLENKEG